MGHWLLNPSEKAEGVAVLSGGCNSDLNADCLPGDLLKVTQIADGRAELGPLVLRPPGQRDGDRMRLMGGWLPRYSLSLL